ncbi:MAG: Hsp20/alpha crystallin family protein [Actinomycetia bacterium]|nr:Hsp20/alpha crystallin family protein [Actinomycetes bacterium]
MESERNKRATGGFGLISDLTELARKLAELGQQGESVGHREFELPGGARGVYGFSVRTGLGRDTPVVNQFGNVKLTDEGAVVSDKREPLVDVFDEGDEIVLVAELPGVNDVDIELVVRGDVVELSAKGPVQKYWCETLLPAEVDATPVARECENGYLQLRLAKLAASPAGESDGE